MSRLSWNSGDGLPRGRYSGEPSRTPRGRGTAARKIYQNREIDTNQPAVPETVSVALDELAATTDQPALEAKTFVAAR